jgi:hypothetical protein
MLEETPTTIGQKIWRGLIGFFLGILVLMLIITLLPAGDMEESLINQLTGRVSTKAGKIGNQSIPMDYFNAARRDCYYQYKEYAPQLADNEGMISNCAFQTLRSVVVGKELADSFGYQISELAIKRELSRQAREYHSQVSQQAGYDKEDLRSVEDIYRNLLRSEPILYRVDVSTAKSLFDGFMRATVKKTESEIGIENESNLAKISIKLVPFNNSVLSEIVDRELTISDDEIRKEYDKETKAGTTPKGENGKPLSFDERKSILTSKIRLDKKNQAIEAKRIELNKKREDGASLEELAQIVSSKPVLFNNLGIQSLSSLSQGDKIYRLTQDQEFLKDMSEKGFGTGKIGGPYKDGEKNYFVEFTSLSLPENLVASGSIEREDSRSLLGGFFLEINQSLGKERPLVRNVRIAGE